MKKHLLCGTIFLLFTLAAAGQAQKPVDLSKLTARPTVDWARDGVIYEVYPRAFSAQGDLNGVTARLDELKKLGVNILWLMPINPIGEKNKKGSIGSPYAVRDYYAINPAYGTKTDLRRLVKEAHAREMKVILDEVLNHTAWDNKLIIEHPEFYKHDASGKILYPEDWTDVAWLDYSNRQLRTYMIGMLTYWMREFDIDGFRFDVAHKPPTDFWDQARAALEKVKPDVFWLAEGDRPADEVKAMDADYSWDLHNALTEVWQGKKPATAIRESWQKQHDAWPKGALHMRFSDNHDERRAIARFGEPGALAAQALMFTLDGIPLIYNGMEVGDTTESGAPALFENLKIFWPLAEKRPEFPRFYRGMIALRRSSEALRRGDVQWVSNTNDLCILSFERHASTEDALVLINSCNRAERAHLDAAVTGFRDATPDITSERTTSTGEAATADVSLEAWGFHVYRRTRTATEQ
ncbi:MAG TPA: alpha-amylase family glycosyl hydrolase [Terriglobales bacterium]|nr:alpha-amylase family glycosyl hydrolase [Terriglobales bacterium]